MNKKPRASKLLLATLAALAVAAALAYTSPPLHRSPLPPSESSRQLEDDDSDGVPTNFDNCPYHSNSNQRDSDYDYAGDACDLDDDNDGVPDEADICPEYANPAQVDCDGDGQGDECRDDDSDGVMQKDDNCVEQFNPQQTDTDGNGYGDACEDDDDGDDVQDTDDNCPLRWNGRGYYWSPEFGWQWGGGWGAEGRRLELDYLLQQDSDSDGIGDVCQDQDSDGLVAEVDNCVDVANEDQVSE